MTPERMHALLERLEWIEYSCPVCGQSKEEGHWPSCELAAALAGTVTDEKHAAMTEGERLVWAAAYAATLDRNLKSPRPNFAADHPSYDEYNAKIAEWETCGIHGAIESAGYAVCYLRDHAESIKLGYGENSATYTMLCGILGLTP